MASIIDQVKVVLGLETKGFGPAQSAIKSLTQGAQSQFASLKNQVAGFFTVAAGTALARSVTQMAERWKDLSEQTGLSTDAIQKYDFAFKKVGLTAENAAQAFDVLTEKRREALEEGGASELLFRKFGISEEELRSLNTGAALFERIARGRSTSNQSDRELFGEVFGAKRGGKMLAGAAALNEGGQFSIVSEADIKAIDQAAKDFALAVLEFKAASAPLVSALLQWSTAALGYSGGDGKAEAKGRNDVRLQLLSDARKQGNKSLAADITKSIRAGGATDAELQGWQMRIAEKNMGRTASVNSVYAPAGEETPEPTPTGDPGEYSVTANKRKAKAAAALAEAEEKLRRAFERSMRGGGAGGSPFNIGPADSLAQIGGIVGGAGMLDPSLTIQQDQLSLLQDIRDEFPLLREAIAEAARSKPIDSIGGGR